MLIYGCDPGFKGAIALYWTDTGKLEVHDMPVMQNPKGKTIINLHSLLDVLRNEADEKCMCLLELVNSRPGQNSSAVFRFGQNFGQLQMAVAANKLPVQYVTPAKWKKYFGLSKDKNASRAMAMDRFPEYAGSLFSRVKDDGRAEAALIALYAAETMV
jgi:crossover junction endodeoxyribonuclease RuvC